MNFVYQNYIFIVAIVIAVYIFVIIREENKFFSYVKRFWFKERSFVSKVSSLFFVIGFSLLALSLLDLRGPEERIKTQVPSKRTVILIDTSASMLAEDVRPSRLEKAVMLAKHFARKAVGHQISVIAFSEIQKKIVPFTADIDLIDARLESIKGLKNQYGSSALSIAIQESIQYFKESADKPQGNILVLTDGEETAESINLKIPDGIYMALVGIGTKNGGRIPLDDRTGLRYGYKSYKGSDVITKLNEDFFKKITSEYKNSKYWIADTYSLPSEEIVSFFNAEFEKGTETQDMVIKPVFMQWLVVPGIIFLIFSYMFKMMRVFVLLSLIMLQPTWAQEKKKEKVMPQHVIEGVNKLQQGELDKQQKLGLAYELQKNDFIEESLKIYNEEKDNLNLEQKFNYGNALLSNQEYAQGFDQYQKILDDKNVSKELRSQIAQNSLLYLKQQEQSQKEKEKQKQNKKKDKNQGNDKNKSHDNQSGEDQSDDQDQGSKDQGKSSVNNQENKDDQPGEDKEDKKKDEDQQEKDQESDKQDAGEKQQKQPPHKMPAKLKQLMSDDRKLQMEMIKRGTQDMNKRKSNSSKDW